MIKEAIAKVIKCGDLSPSEMGSVMEEIMTGAATVGQMASFLTALSTKGETIDELTAAVSVMRRHVRKIKAKKRMVLDTCGTGGDRKGTFNISTIAAFVAAGAGVTVAKHGNRSVSSSCGSADLLEELGIDINLKEADLEECLNSFGIAFLFAPNLHPAMKYAAPVRKEIGIRTIFNLLGPLTNPASATHQLIGVYDASWTRPLACVLGRLGARHALVVHGKDGLDEVTTVCDTLVSECRGGRVRSYRINPRDFGIKRSEPDGLCGGSREVNAEIAMDVLEGGCGAKRDIVVLNAGCAIYAADKARSIKEGIKMAERSLDSKAALKKLELLRSYSQGAKK